MKFQRLIRREVIPIALLSATVALCFKFKTEIENMLPGSSEVITQKDERYISKKLAGLLDYTSKYGKIPVSEDCIDV